MKIETDFTIQKKTTDNDQNLLYGLMGEEDFLDDSGNPRIKSDDNPKIMAKAIKTKLSKHMTESRISLRYYIRTKPNNIIYNPIKIESSVKDKETFNFINNTCKNNIDFKEVTQSIFDKYLTFLRTKNVRWLNAAQRELK